MKLWGMVALSVMLASWAVDAAQVPSEQPIKDTDGTTLAVVVVCNDCQAAKGKTCNTGVEDGWMDGAPCGKCLLQSNLHEAIKYPYDLQIAGTLTDSDGNPVKDRFVKAFLPNGWAIRARTSDKGIFRLLLGATAARKSNKPLLTDIGTRIDAQSAQDAYYAIFLMPPSYKPCAADAMATPALKSKKAAKPPSKKK